MQVKAFEHRTIRGASASDPLNGGVRREHPRVNLEV